MFEAIEKFKPSFAPLVPTMFIGMLNHPEMGTRDLSSLEESFSGSSPLPLEIINTFQKRTGSIIVEGYGLTESSPVPHVNPFKGTRKPGSIGLPLSDVSCRIVDAEDGVTQMPVGKPGELMVKGPQHPKRGEAIKVFLQLKQGTNATQEEIIEFCSHRLAKYKWPIEVEIRETLPKSTVGKILKKDLIGS